MPNIIFGATIKEDLVDMVKISVIATGLMNPAERLREYAGIGRIITLMTNEYF